MKKIIFHIDINAFFSTVEEILNPSLSTKPIGICGSNSKSVLSTCNYIARKYGIHAGMKSYIAKELCPNIIFIKPKHNIYKQISQKFINYIMEKYTKQIEVISIDECFMDVSNIIEKYHNNYLILAKQIQNDIFKKMHLPISIGISDQKIFAKIASDFKKPMGISTLFTNEVENKLWPLNIENYIGIGKAKIIELNKLNIYTIKDFIEYENYQEMEKLLKNQYWKILNVVKGNLIDDEIDKNKIINKSISKAKTFIKEENDIERIYEQLNIVVNELIYTLNKYNLTGYSFAVSIKYLNKKLISKCITFKNPIDFNNIFSISKTLFIELWNELPIIYISVKMGKLNCC